MRKREREREIVRKEQLTVTWLRTILQVNDNTQKKKKTAFRCNAINVKMGELQTKLKKKNSQFILAKITSISVLYTQFCNFTTFANAVKPQFYLFLWEPPKMM